MLGIRCILTTVKCVLLTISVDYVGLYRLVLVKSSSGLTTYAGMNRPVLSSVTTRVSHPLNWDRQLEQLTLHVLLLLVTECTLLNVPDAVLLCSCPQLAILESSRKWQSCLFTWAHGTTFVLSTCASACREILRTCVVLLAATCLLLVIVCLGLVSRNLSMCSQLLGANGTCALLIFRRNVLGILLVECCVPDSASRIPLFTTTATVIILTRPYYVVNGYNG